MAKCRGKIAKSCTKKRGCKTTTSGRRRSYCRNLHNRSKCRGKNSVTCVKRKGCKTTVSGRRRSYCRKSHNRKR